MNFSWGVRSYQGSEMDVEDGERIICKCWRFFAAYFIPSPRFDWYRAKYDGHPYIAIRIGWLAISWGEQGDWLTIE